MNLDSVRSAYWAPAGFEKELVHEVGSSFVARIDRLVLSSDVAREHVWTHNIWYAPNLIPIESISLGAKSLKQLGHDWVLAPVAHHRRSSLIQEGLPRKKRPKRIEFLGEIPSSPPGTWALLEPNLALASPKCSSLVPNGDAEFEENKTEPPSRAYLKLWELMTLHGVRPARNSNCLDLGACPGGWTWVLSEIGTSVTAIDKAPLATNVAHRSNVTTLAKDAFKLNPNEIGDVDWLFSDMICDPKKLLELVRRWLESGRCKNFVCTLKYKGATDFATTAAFREIPGSKCRHLYHNKHEVTWWLTSS